jgi:hypothetical protein
MVKYEKICDLVAAFMSLSFELKETVPILLPRYAFLLCQPSDVEEKMDGSTMYPLFFPGLS